MNYPPFDEQRNVAFEIKTDYTEAECDQFFPHLEMGFYRLDESLFLMRIEGFGAMIQSVNESELARLYSQGIECEIKELPPHIAHVFDSHLPLYEVNQVLQAMNRLIHEGLDPEMN